MLVGTGPAARAADAEGDGSFYARMICSKCWNLTSAQSKIYWQLISAGYAERDAVRIAKDPIVQTCEIIEFCLAGSPKK